MKKTDLQFELRSKWNSDLRPRLRTTSKRKKDGIMLPLPENSNVNNSTTGLPKYNIFISFSRLLGTSISPNKERRLNLTVARYLDRVPYRHFVTKLDSRITIESSGPLIDNRRRNRTLTTNKSNKWKNIALIKSCVGNCVMFNFRAHVHLS